MWTDDWIGIPYLPGGRSRAGMDCVGLVLTLLAVRKGILLPDPGESLSAQLAARVRERAKGRWIAADEPFCEGDVACFLTERGRDTHVGYCIDKERMLDADEALGVRLGPIRAVGFTGAWRYA